MIIRKSNNKSLKLTDKKHIHNNYESNESDGYNDMMPSKSVSVEKWIHYPVPIPESNPEGIVLYNKKLKDWIVTTPFKHNEDYKFFDNNSLYLNTHSERYESLLDAINSFESDFGFYHSSPTRVNANATRKNWKTIVFTSNNMFSLDRIVSFLKKRGLIYNIDFVVRNNTFLVNEESIGDVNTLMTVMKDRGNFGIEDFSIEDKKEGNSFDESLYYGNESDDKFFDERYDHYSLDSMFNFLKSNYKKSIDINFFLIKTREELIRELVEVNGRTDFYIDLGGIIYYPITEAEIFEPIIHKYEVVADNRRILLEGLDDNARQKLLSEYNGYLEYINRDYINQKKGLMNLFEDSSQPFYFLPQLSDEEFNQFFKTYELIKVKQMPSSTFYRNVLDASGVFPGYDCNIFKIMNLPWNDEEILAFKDLAIKRGIKFASDLDHIAKEKESIYEYTCAYNDYEFLKVNALFYEFFSNMIQPNKNNQSTDDVKYKIKYAVTSIIYSLLDELRKNEYFKPRSDDENAKKEAKDFYDSFIRKYLDNTFDYAEHIISVVFKGKENMMQKFKTVSSLKASPFYREIVKIMNRSISENIREISEIK